MQWSRGALASFLIVAAGCGPSSSKPGGAPGGASDMAVPPSPPAAPDMAPVVYDDFPPAPVLDPNGTTPPNAPGLFGPRRAARWPGGPCLLDPEPGSVFPQNWMRLRFHLAPVAGQNLFEIRLHAADETNDLVVYTQQTTGRWTRRPGRRRQRTSSTSRSP